MKKLFAACAAIVVLWNAPALSADMAARAPLYAKSPVMAPAYDWTGFYVGIQGGYGWKDDGLRATVDTLPGLPFVQNVSGAEVGGTAGYNWQIDRFLVGVEADFSWTDIKATTITGGQCGGGATCDEKLQWFGTARGRVGVLAMPSLLLYATGGVAWGREDARVATAIGTFDPWRTAVGWTAGAGIEGMFAPNWTAKAEYLYVDLGNQDFPANAAAPAVLASHQQFNFNLVRFGVNYKFGGPVVARY